MDTLKRIQLQYISEHGELLLRKPDGSFYGRSELRAIVDYLEGEGYVSTSHSGELKVTEKGERKTIYHVQLPTQKRDSAR